MKKSLFFALIMGLCSAQAATIYFKNTLPVKDENFIIWWYESKGFKEYPTQAGGTLKSEDWTFTKTKGLPESITTDAGYFLMWVDMTGEGCPEKYPNQSRPLNCYSGGASVVDGKEYVVSSAGPGIGISITLFNREK